MKLLHIVASPRRNESRTLSVSDAYLEQFQNEHPDAHVEEVDVFRSDLPELTVRDIGGAYQTLGDDRVSDPDAEWTPVQREIERLQSADQLLISAPMWNFSVPYKLKQYIDLVVQPGYTFEYTSDGPEGLLDASGVVITSRGGDYSEGTGAESLDHQEPYLRTILSFMGVDPIQTVNAQPMDSGDPETRSEVLEQARTHARNLVNRTEKVPA